MTPIYLDYMATTPLDPEVVRAMTAALNDPLLFGNPHSQHSYGEKALNAINKARQQLAALVNTSPDNLIWTSGATEANNLALKGVTHFYQRQGRHIITSAIEHKSVLDCCKFLQTSGFEVTYLPPQADGIITPEQIAAHLRPETILVSIMHANNEIGTIQNIAAIGQLLKKHGAIFHVDAAQSLGKIAIDLQQLSVDLMSFSFHKIYGPKGIGALYLQPRRHLTPLLHGGSQERHLRAGTLATQQIIGAGVACQLAQQYFERDLQHQKQLQQIFLKELQNIPNITINGNLNNRLPGNLNISIANLNTEQLAQELPQLALSTTSACYSECPTEVLRPSSYVLKALGKTEELIANSLRISFGRFTTLDEAHSAASYLKQRIHELMRT